MTLPFNPQPKISSRAVTKEMKCNHCGVQYQTTLGKYNYSLKNHKNNYCSDLCARTAKRKRALITCKQCGNQFEERMSKIKEGAKFCNRTCWNEWNKENPNFKVMSGVDNSGNKNGQYKHGKYIGKGRSGGDSNKLKVRKQVIEHDGDWCLMCGKPSPGLHLHRVVYGSQGGKYEVDNCVQLCVVHHQEVHTSKKKWFPILDEHLKKRGQTMEDRNAHNS